mgnify:CR=1 FL=1
MTTALELYRLYFRDILETDGLQRVSNCSADHAAVLNAELIRSAVVSVDVYCHRLSSDIWGRPEIVEEVAAARARGVRFRVVVQEFSREDIAASAFQFLGDSVLMWSSPNMTANFLIRDGKSFRFEPDFHERKGFAYANNGLLSGKLVNVFEGIYKVASQVAA